jgi:hypothetical protein
VEEQSRRERSTPMEQSRSRSRSSPAARLDAGPVGVGAKASRSGGEGAPLGARWSKEIR